MKNLIIFMLLVVPTLVWGQLNMELTNQVNAFMDTWHHAATTADEEKFFGSMHPEGIYIGTDASEYWKRDEMAKWAEPYFQRDTAWAFTAVSRNAYLHDSKDLIWFDELLDTWMGPCRASGVIQMDDSGKMLIRHYHLSIAVPNDAVQSYLKIIGLPTKE